MLSELDKKKVHLAALDTFLGGPVHDGYKTSVNFSIDETRKQIVNVEPISEVDRAEHFKLHGELRLLEQMLSVFEEARIKLKARIDEMVEAQLTDATNTKQ